MITKEESKMEEEIKFPNIAHFDEKDGSFTNFCTSRGFPMGGIGTGGFNILTDGGFGKFRTNHNWFRFVKALDFPKGTFFAIRSKKLHSDEIISRILRGKYQGGQEFTNITSIQKTNFIGKLPRFSLKFEDPQLHPQVELTGWTPIIPHKKKDSSLPVGCFEFSVHNPTNFSLEISLMFSFENLLGLGGSGSSWLLLRDGPVTYRSTKGNYAKPWKSELKTHKEIAGIQFKTTQDYSLKNPRQRTIGEYFITTLLDKTTDIKISLCHQWSSKDKTPRLFQDFHTYGKIKSIYEGKKSNSGALCLTFQLKPNSSRTIPFSLVWWTPYHVIEKHQRIHRLTGNHQGRDFGHYYLNHFQSPSFLIQYIYTELSRMKEETLQLEQILAHSSLPSWLQTYILNSIDSVLVNTCYTKEAEYYMIEGCPWDWPFGGLTGTIDQRLASHPYSAAFFPEMDLSELEVFRDLTQNGEVPHGDGHCDVMLHSTNVPYGMPLKLYNKTRVWTDLPQSFILQYGKTIIQTNNWTLLREIWGEFREMMALLEQSTVDGIPDGITTYDYAYYRPHFIYSAGLQLVTLEMLIFLGEQLIKSDNVSVEISNEEEIAIRRDLQNYHKQFSKCKTTMKSKLWQEAGYFQTCSSKNTIFTGALAGDWFSFYSGLSPVFDFDEALSHAKWQEVLLMENQKYLLQKGKKLRPLIYRETDVNGKEMLVKDNMFINQAQVNNPWQVIAFMALEWIYLGNTQQGLRVIKRIWDKGYYEGYPWDMDHWGFSGHIYMTHPIMWALFNALTGVSLNFLQESLSFSPRPFDDSPNMKIPVFFPTTWFYIDYNQTSKQTRIEVIKSFEKAGIITKIICSDKKQNKSEVKLAIPWTLEEGSFQEFLYPF